MNRLYYPHLRIIAVSLLLSSSLVWGDEFPDSLPEAQGIHSDTLRELSEWVRSEGHDVRSMLLLRNGKLVFEWYPGDVSRDQHQLIYSITKSVVATLAGIAIVEKDISGTSTPLSKLFPDADTLKKDDAKAGITLKDLLTMRSGFPQARANEPTGPMRELFDRIQQQPDRLAYILDQIEMSGTPGEEFAYNNIDPQLVLSAIETGSGKRGYAYAKAKLFDPLGFETVKWLFADESGAYPGGFGLRMRPIDLAKIGQLYLQEGKWDGRQLVDERWIAECIKDQTGKGYGYYWWLDPATGTFSGKGVKGQRLEVNPERQLVFVLTANLPAKEIGPVTKKIYEEFVLKAVTSEGSLPENPSAVEKLKEELQIASRHIPASRANAPKSNLPQD